MSSSLTSTRYLIKWSSKGSLNHGLGVSLSLFLKVGIQNNPYNYRKIMISPLLAKLYGIILENKINIWLESEGNRAKGQAGFRRQHSKTNHLVTLRIILEECHNYKSNLFCCFVEFREAFDTVPRNNLWNRLEQLKVLPS